MSLTHEELEERLDDIASMGRTRQKAHIKALMLDWLGEDEEEVNLPAETRNELRHELRSVVEDV